MARRSGTPLYRAWQGMLRRCYDKKWQLKSPTYVGCTVCDEWLQLSRLWKWAGPLWKPGLQLDKDIIHLGNNIYSPEKCCFVSRSLNSLLNMMKARRGKWPLGVCCEHGRFKAGCSVNGCIQHIGYFDTPEDAHQAYIRFRIKYILAVAREQTDKRVAKGLRAHAENMRSIL